MPSGPTIPTKPTTWPPAAENVRFLPGVTLPDTVHIDHDPATVLHGADLVLIIVPIRRLRENWEAIGHLIEPHAAIVSGIKGLDPAHRPARQRTRRRLGR